MFKEPIEIGKIGEIAEKLEDINNFLHEKFVLFPIDHIPLVLEGLFNSNNSFLQVYFTLGYLGVKNQLEKEVWREDVANRMENFMQWSREKVRNHVRVKKLLNLGQFYAENNDVEKSIECHEEVLRLDPDNRIAFIALAGLYRMRGEAARSNDYRRKYEVAKGRPDKNLVTKDPLVEFQELVTKLQQGQKQIDTIRNRKIYHEIGVKKSGLLVLLMESIGFVGKTTKTKESEVTIGDLRVILDDLSLILTDWLAVLSGLVFFVMERKLGTPEQINLVLEVLKDVLGLDGHKDFSDMDKSVFVEYDRQKEMDLIQSLERDSMISTQKRHQSYGDLKRIDLSYKESGQKNIFRVVDFEEQDRIKNMVKPKERVIKNNQITIVFGYPLSKTVKIVYENRKGFTRMDLFKHIYEGYKKIYDEEEVEVGDPGHYKFAYNRKMSFGKYGIWNHCIEDLYLESVYYSPRFKTVELFIGS